MTISHTLLYSISTNLRHSVISSIITLLQSFTSCVLQYFWYDVRPHSIIYNTHIINFLSDESLKLQSLNETLWFNDLSLFLILSPDTMDLLCNNYIVLKMWNMMNNYLNNFSSFESPLNLRNSDERITYHQLLIIQIKAILCPMMQWFLTLIV